LRTQGANRSKERREKLGEGGREGGKEGG